MASPLDRFTSRAGFYARHRPGYPDEVIQVLAREAGWTRRAVVADIGAGTGISSELFLRHGNEVIGIEPNADMRAAAAALASKYPRFRLIDATAEETTLPDASVDFVVAATAFHWFDHDRCRDEFRRILKPGGHVVLLWNERGTSSPFLQAYEQLLARFGKDYKVSWSRQRAVVGEACARFFAPAPCGFHGLPNAHSHDFEGLRERLLSSSYSPLPGEAGFEPMIAALREIFDRFHTDGKVVIEYETSIYWGQMHYDLVPRR